MKSKNKKKMIVLWSLYGVLLVATILIIAFSKYLFGYKQQIGPGGIITWEVWPIFDKQVSDIEFFQYMYSKALPAILRTIEIIGIAVTLSIILHYLAKITIRSKKGLTIAKLIVNFIKWIIAIASFFFIIKAWGADTTTMLASAGVLTLIIGLGSQALIADILAGVFIVFEGDYQVGDIVIIDGWRGEVKEIGIRTTRLVDVGGNIKIVNNSAIKNLINQTQELSIAKSYVSITYEADLKQIEKVIEDNITLMSKNIPLVVGQISYKGVSELAESGVVLLFTASCKEQDVYQVQRDMNRQIKLVFDENKIAIPFNQLDVHLDK